MFLLLLLKQLDSDINNNNIINQKSEEQNDLSNREISHISIIKNIDQEDLKKSIVNESLIGEEPSETLALKEFINNILDNMNSNDNVLPDAKELQKAVLGRKSFI